MKTSFLFKSDVTFFKDAEDGGSIVVSHSESMNHTVEMLPMGGFVAAVE